MTRFFLFVIVIAVAGYFFPQVYEETGNTCQALEKKALRLNTDQGAAGSIIAGVTLALTDGSLGQKMAEDQYPDLPKPLGCVVTYYDFPDDWKH